MSAKKIERAALEAYYENLPREFDFSSKCKMTLLGDLSGKRILDVNCRRGKGVVKLANMAGPAGETVGTDPSAAFIEDARLFARQSRERGNLDRCSARFLVAFPEDLAAAGLEDGAFDVVFANSSVNVGYDIACIFEELCRVLRPGGLLVLDSVVAEGERDAHAMKQARAIGNVVQAAPGRHALEALLANVGFECIEYFEEAPIEASEGYLDDYKVPVAESDETVAFTKTTVHAIKRDE